MNRAGEAVNLVTTNTGRTRAVCQFCGRMSRSVNLQGRCFSLDDLATGWWMAPFPDTLQHASDGSSGSLFTCPTCADAPLPWTPRAYLETAPAAIERVEPVAPSRGRRALTAGAVRSGFASLVREFRTPDSTYAGMPCSTPTTGAFVHDRAVTLVLLRCPACGLRKVVSWCRSCTRYGTTHDIPQTCGLCGHDAPESEFHSDASPLEARCGA